MEEQRFRYDPLKNKSPRAAVVKNTAVTFFVQTKERVSQMIFCVKPDGDFPYEEHKMSRTRGGYLLSHTFLKSGHYWYYFKAQTESETLYLYKNYFNYGELSSDKGDDFFVLVTEKEYSFDNLLAGKVIYQIMVDRFNRVGAVKVREPLVLRDDWGGGIQKNTSDPTKINLEVFGGNIKGIIAKLDYLKELGVGVIYLNPIGMANSNHKYDTADYMTIDSMFGTEKDFIMLVSQASARGIGIIIDGVYNHTGSDSIYFNKYGRFKSVGAYNSKDSKYYSWYDFTEYPEKYRSWWGIDTLPSIRHKSELFQNYIAGEGGVLEKYMKLGVAGVRLDVVDEISDDFVAKIEKKVHSLKKNAVVMGEVWEDASTKISYGKRRKYFAENELNSVMNYPFKDSLFCMFKTKSANSFVATIRMIQNNYPEPVAHSLMNFLGTHDTSRVHSELLSICDGNKEWAMCMLKIAFVILFTCMGVPSIFYGDEIAMQNNDGSSRGCYDWESGDSEMFEFVKILSKLRQREVFKYGDMNFLSYANGKLIYERISNEHSKKRERIITLINIKESPLVVELQGNYVSLLSQKSVSKINLKYLDFEILEEKK